MRMHEESIAENSKTFCVLRIARVSRGMRYVVRIPRECRLTLQATLSELLSKYLKCTYVFCFCFFWEPTERTLWTAGIAAWLHWSGGGWGLFPLLKTEDQTANYQSTIVPAGAGLIHGSIQKLRNRCYVETTGRSLWNRNPGMRLISSLAPREANSSADRA